MRKNDLSTGFEPAAFGLPHFDGIFPGPCSGAPFIGFHAGSLLARSMQND